MTDRATPEKDVPCVRVERTAYPWTPGPGREWMWRCNRVDDCPKWHYTVDDIGFADSHSEAVRLGLAHAAIPHPDETRPLPSGSDGGVS